MTFLSYYGLSFNPFDKQQVKEKDRSDPEVAGYVRHKIACAGGAESIIDPAALSAVHSHSQGNPRVIDNLMTDVLLLGQQLDKKIIDPELILAAVSGQNLM